MMAIAFERYRREKCMVVIYLIFNPRWYWIDICFKTGDL
jgi:hypothetical protein